MVFSMSVFPIDPESMDTDADISEKKKMTSKNMKDTANLIRDYKNGRVFFFFFSFSFSFSFSFFFFFCFCFCFVFNCFFFFKIIKYFFFQKVDGYGKLTGIKYENLDIRNWDRWSSKLRRHIFLVEVYEVLFSFYVFVIFLFLL